MDGENAATPFNFSRAGLLATDQLRTLRTLDEQFARNLTHTLGAWLRTNIAVAPLNMEQCVYSAFADRTATGTYVLPLRVEPQQARAAMSLALTMAPTIIDLLLGGSGRVAPGERELTEIEEAVLGSVLELVLREWGTAWAPFGMGFEAAPRARGGHNDRPMPPQERVFCCAFQVTMGDLTGELLFCMPAPAVTATLRTFAQRRDRQRQRTAEERKQMASRLRAARVHTALHFPPVRLRAGALRSLHAGSLLPLPLQRGTTAEIRVAGRALFRALPVRSGEHRAAQVERVVDMPGIAAEGV